MNTKTDIGAIYEKLDYIENNVCKDAFNNPIKQAITDIRLDFVDFAKTFEEEMKILNNDLAKGLISESNHQDNLIKDKLEYRIAHILRSFNEYENKTKSEIESLKVQKAKDEYRINHLIRSLEEKDKK